MQYFEDGSKWFLIGKEPIVTFYVLIFSEMIIVYDNFTLQIFNFTIHTIILSNKKRLIKVTLKTELFNKNLLPKLNNYWNYVNNHFAELIIKGGYSITKVIKLIDK